MSDQCSAFNWQAKGRGWIVKQEGRKRGEEVPCVQEDGYRLYQKVVYIKPDKS
jgi:hypothetical protein